MTGVPRAGRAPQTSTPARQRWSFSFRFWQQVDNFGFHNLSEMSDHWFVSLLERLYEMGYLYVDDVLENHNVREQLRFHEIDDDDNRTTFKRNQFTWLEQTYLNNPDSYPIFQFHVSKALGRIVGFFDEGHIFCVLLLDPRHNIQLSAYSGYSIRECKILESEHELLRSAIDKAIDHIHRDEFDRAHTALVKATVHRSGPDGEARVVITVQESDAKSVEKLLREHKLTLRQIFEGGLELHIDKL